MDMRTECVYCVLSLMDRNFAAVEDDPQERMKFLKMVCRMVADAPAEMPPPVLNGRIMQIIAERAGKEDLFEEEKHVYNQAILKMQDDIWAHIQEADDKLYRAMQYAMAGNYIDFGTGSRVSERKLHELIESAVDIDLGSAYERFREDLKSAKSLAYLHDNCGEIVFDKMCIAEIKALYPNLKITAVVRGMPTYNDVTMADAIETGLVGIVDVVDNGMGIPGTMLGQISEQARSVIEQADVVVAKGMGNYETMEGCGLNVYYLLLCKCERFMRAFNLPHLSSVFAAERG